MAKCGKGWNSNDGKTSLSCAKHWAHPTPVHTDGSGRKFIVVGKSVFMKPGK
jgi:hypothetical protein